MLTPFTVRTHTGGPMKTVHFQYTI